MSVVGTISSKTARSSLKPYVERALHDEQLHANAQRAYEAGRSVFERLRSEPDVRSAARRLAADESLRSELGVAVAEAKAFARRAAAPPACRRRRLRRALLAAGIGALLFTALRRLGHAEPL